MKTVKTAGTILACLIFCAGCSTRPLNREVPREDEKFSIYMEETVRQFREKEKLAGVSAAVVVRGETILAVGDGMADKAAGLELSAETPMPVGSISKIFTALAVLQLVEEGRLDLDEPAGSYIPDFRMAGSGNEKITIRHLLTHHAGLPGDQLGGWIPEKAGLEELRTLPPALADTPLISEPGTHFSYSNIGFGLLGLVIESVSGMSYDSFIKTRIFEPAGMEDAMVYPETGDPRLPLGYGKGEPLPPPCIRDIPAGSFLLSARDAAAFLRTLYPESGSGLLGREYISRMLQPQFPEAGADGRFEIGLGFWLIDPFGTATPLASHGGELPPFNALLITLPEHRSGILVSSNDFGTDGSGALRLGVELAENLLEFLGEKPEGIPLPPERAWRPGEPAEWAGLYPSLMGPIELESRGRGLLVRLAGKTLHAVPREEGAFTLEFRVLGIPLPVKALESLRLDLYEFGGETWLGFWMRGVFAGSVKRIPVPQGNEEFEIYTGHYTPVDDARSGVIEDVVIRRKKGIYFLDFTLLGMGLSFPLRSEGEGRAVTAGQGRGLGELLVFSETGDGIALDFSGLRLNQE